MIKPTIAKLVGNKFLGGQKGFVDTFNWAVESIANLKGGEGISIDWQDGSHPIIKKEEGEGVKFEGTDGTQTDGTTNPVKFASATDSNVVVSCADGKITIGVYYI